MRETKLTDKQKQKNLIELIEDCEKLGVAQNVTDNFKKQLNEVESELEREEAKKKKNLLVTDAQTNKQELSNGLVCPKIEGLK